MRISFRRILQALSLTFFCLLFFMQDLPFLPAIPPDIFLRLDPLSCVSASLCSRTLFPQLLPSLLVLLSALLIGRFFCGWLCPMGALLDGLGTFLRIFFKSQGIQSAHDPVPRSTKYFILSAFLAAALCGVNLAFLLSPIPLLTRLCTFILHPLGLEGIQDMVSATTPLLQWMNLTEISYWQPNVRFFHLAWFTALCWLTLAVLELVRPRFWCRYLCPAGALMALLSRNALLRRSVSSTCSSCGKCSKNCPMGIVQNPGKSQASECLMCRNCSCSCSQNATRFSFLPSTLHAEDCSLSRRQFFAASVSGIALSFLHGMYPGTDPHPVLVRPPGSLPETKFLELCLGCSECMKVCPTGALQPAGFQGGLSSFLTPFLDPRSGACRPDCLACGRVCPVQAILKLERAEKQWAKIGTAVLDRNACLAWSENKRCMVCKENCPYDAIDIVQEQGFSVALPRVEARRCYGCGYCEKHCPKEIAAIHVVSDGAIRLPDHSFEQTARAEGLEFDALSSHAKETDSPGTAPPPGFLE